MSENTVYVVTGGNRGIGLGIVKELLARPSTTVIATARNGVAAFEDLPVGQGSIFHAVQLDYSKTIEAADIKKQFEAVPGFDKVHVLIANAGHASTMHDILHTPPADLRAATEINTIAPLTTFQALWPYMTGDVKKFVYISSSVGSKGMMEPMPGGSYGPSKAAGNWIAKALHLQLEREGLVSMAVHPGFVKTEMGVSASEQWGVLGGPPDEVVDSARGVVGVIDRDEFGGKFVTQNGVELDW